MGGTRAGGSTASPTELQWQLDELEDPYENAAAWETFIMEHPGAWRDLVEMLSSVTLGADADHFSCKERCGEAVGAGHRI